MHICGQATWDLCSVVVLLAMSYGIGCGTYVCSRVHSVCRGVRYVACMVLATLACLHVRPCVVDCCVVGRRSAPLRSVCVAVLVGVCVFVCSVCRCFCLHHVVVPFLYAPGHRVLLRSIHQSSRARDHGNDTKQQQATNDDAHTQQAHGSTDDRRGSVSHVMAMHTGNNAVIHPVSCRGVSCHVMSCHVMSLYVGCRRILLLLYAVRCAACVCCMHVHAMCRWRDNNQQHPSRISSCCRHMESSKHTEMRMSCVMSCCQHGVVSCVLRVMRVMCVMWQQMHRARIACDFGLSLHIRSHASARHSVAARAYDVLMCHVHVHVVCQSTRALSSWLVPCRQACVGTCRS